MPIHAHTYAYTRTHVCAAHMRQLAVCILNAPRATRSSQYYFFISLLKIGTCFISGDRENFGPEHALRCTVKKGGAMAAAGTILRSPFDPLLVRDSRRAHEAEERILNQITLTRPTGS